MKTYGSKNENKMSAHFTVKNVIRKTKEEKLNEMLVLYIQCKTITKICVKELIERCAKDCQLFLKIAGYRPWQI